MSITPLPLSSNFQKSRGWFQRNTSKSDEQFEQRAAFWADFLVLTCPESRGETFGCRASCSFEVARDGTLLFNTINVSEPSVPGTSPWPQPVITATILEAAAGVHGVNTEVGVLPCQMFERLREHGWQAAWGSATCSIHRASLDSQRWKRNTCWGQQRTFGAESRFSRGLLYLGGTRNPLVDVGPLCFLLMGSRECTCGALSTWRSTKSSR